MKTGKIITGAAIGAVVALLIIPKTRRMLTDAVCSIKDSFKDMLDDANDAAQKGKQEMNKIADKAKDVAGSVKATKEAWNA